MPRGPYFAHTGDPSDKTDWHRLAAHLQGTGARAADFLEAAGFGDFGRVAGLLHDIGKYTPKFQSRLAGDTGRVDHSTAGAQVAVERFGQPIGKMLAFCVAGHHAGLANGVNGEQISSLDDRLKRQIEKLDPVWEDEITIGAIGKPGSFVPRSDITAGFSAAFLIRMLFSALVDADFLDTEAYYEGLRGQRPVRGGHPTLGRLRERLDQYLQALTRSAVAGPINAFRAEILTHGAVMSTKGANCGQVRGPVQFAFARSIEPVLPLEISITRMAATTAADAESKGDIRTMGRKHIVPYGLYRAHGYVSASLAGGGGRGTGFSEEDVELLWSALELMFDHDRSAARGEMSARRLILFKHDSPIGNAPAHRLFELVTVERVFEGEKYVPGDRLAHNLRPARAFSDYVVHVDDGGLPAGVQLIDRI